jgi:hypothetical protein
MSKTKGIVLGADHVNHVGPAGAFIGNPEGYSPGEPNRSGGGSTRGSTVTEQYRGGGINTKPNERGTPFNSQLGNPNEASRTAPDSGRYGKVISENGQDHNDPRANGSGVVLDGANSYARGFQPPPAATVDSPVPTRAPRFDPNFVSAEDREHVGSGNESAVDGLAEGKGVMSR